jgi:hypothetical protein
MCHIQERHAELIEASPRRLILITKVSLPEMYFDKLSMTFYF